MRAVDPVENPASLLGSPAQDDECGLRRVLVEVVEFDSLTRCDVNSTVIPQMMSIVTADEITGIEDINLASSSRQNRADGRVPLTDHSDRARFGS